MSGPLDAASVGGRLSCRRVPVVFERREPVPHGSRLALLASWGPDATVSESLVELTRQLETNGYPVALIRASDDQAPLRWPEGAPLPHIVIRKPNVGYDFGSWAVGMHHLRDLLRREHVLLVNDSLVGPFRSIAPLLHDFENCTSDAWAATGTTQFIPHLQSFFLGFRHGILADRSLRDFWEHLPLEDEKLTIVDRYELGLSRLLFAEAFSTSAAFEPEMVVRPGDNPSVIGWSRLLDLGFPFVKREIVLNPAVAPSGEQILSRVHREFGIDALQWI